MSALTSVIIEVFYTFFHRLAKFFQLIRPMNHTMLSFWIKIWSLILVEIDCMYRGLTLDPYLEPIRVKINVKVNDPWIIYKLHNVLDNTLYSWYIVWWLTIGYIIGHTFPRSQSTTVWNTDLNDVSAYSIMSKLLFQY